ncbi:hypothetical protein QBC46DRAFT_300508 [Diplogelasinospora grovesii]|uniref:RRM domain-containing protein n=1 Tax=Diplogelasinospora grovesii TaxID=303347 RepID=A0AAN6MW03_9PEZI|nr:hypothetical protein QBC46DRAFT_300508 [Diplogelasinospora grovesii]
MHSFRRAAFRSAISASRAVAPKTQSVPLVVQFGSSIATRTTSMQAARCFSQTAFFRNTEERTDTQAADGKAVEEAAYADGAIESAETSTSETANYNAEQQATQLPPNGIFFRNLPFDATEDQIKELFQGCGEIKDLVLVKDARGLSRGFGFAYFAEQESQQKAIDEFNGSFWHGRRVQVARRTPKPERRRGRSTITDNEPTRSLYIGNIPYDTTDNELNQLFRGLEGVKGVRIAVDKTTGWPRGFAHCDFIHVEAAIAAMEKLSGAEFGGRVIRVDYALEKYSNRRGGDRQQRDFSQE